MLRNVFPHIFAKIKIYVENERNKIDVRWQRAVGGGDEMYRATKEFYRGNNIWNVLITRTMVNMTIGGQ